MWYNYSTTKIGSKYPKDIAGKTLKYVPHIFSKSSIIPTQMCETDKLSIDWDLGEVLTTGNY